MREEVFVQNGRPKCYSQCCVPFLLKCCFDRFLLMFSANSQSIYPPQTLLLLQNLSALIGENDNTRNGLWWITSSSPTLLSLPADIWSSCQHSRIITTTQEPIESSPSTWWMSYNYCSVNFPISATRIVRERTFIKLKINFRAEFYYSCCYERVIYCLIKFGKL